MDERCKKEATEALHVLYSLRSGYRIDVVGLGTFTFVPFGQSSGAPRMLPGGGVVKEQRGVAAMVRGFVSTMGHIQQRLEEGNGV